jgi:hypothetical protein
MTEEMCSLQVRFSGAILGFCRRDLGGSFLWVYYATYNITID